RRRPAAARGGSRSRTACSWSHPPRRQEDGPVGRRVCRPGLGARGSSSYTDDATSSRHHRDHVRHSRARQTGAMETTPPADAPQQTAPPTTRAWGPDVLGPEFRSLVLPLPSGAQATLVEHTPEAAPRTSTAPLVDRETWIPIASSLPEGFLDDVVVLFVHGWSDYFYHRHLARFWAHLGARFYALDLQGYGRNLDPDRVQRANHGRTDEDGDLQRPGFITDLSEYDADLEAALDVIEEAHPHRRIVLS